MAGGKTGSWIGRMDLSYENRDGGMSYVKFKLKKKKSCVCAHPGLGIPFSLIQYLSTRSLLSRTWGFQF